MDTVLLTGAGPKGVTGRRIKEQLANRYRLLTPSSMELDLTDSDAVNDYFSSHKIDYIIHSAVFSPSRGHSSSNCDKEIEDNLKMYFNLARNSHRVKKMFYFGSGAEFDKSHPVIDVREEDFGNDIPEDKYGLIKYIINCHAISSRNIYNLRLFGVINPYEPTSRNVVSNLCAKALIGLPLILNQDCVFSFIDVDDVARFIILGMERNLEHHSYNMVGGTYTLKEVAETVREIKAIKECVRFFKDGKGKQYSGANGRLMHKLKSLTPLRESIEKVLDYIEKEKDTIDVEMLDNRWRKKV